MVVRLRSICRRRASAMLFAAALLLTALFAVASNSGEQHSVYLPAAVEQAIEGQGAPLSVLPPASSDPNVRSVTPRRYAIGSMPIDPAHRETIAVYAFPTAAERSKGEDELRSALAASGGLPPVFYDRGNILVLYRPLAVVNQTGTKYGELLRSALASL